jgi:hypothetical protein
MFNSMVFRCLMLSFYLLSVIWQVGGFATVHYCDVLPALIKVFFFFSCIYVYHLCLCLWVLLSLPLFLCHGYELCVCIVYFPYLVYYGVTQGVQCCFLRCSYLRDTRSTLCSSGPVLYFLDRRLPIHKKVCYFLSVCSLSSFFLISFSYWVRFYGFKMLFFCVSVLSRPLICCSAWLC